MKFLKLFTTLLIPIFCSSVFATSNENSKRLCSQMVDVLTEEFTVGSAAPRLLMNEEKQKRFLSYIKKSNLESLLTLQPTDFFELSCAGATLTIKSLAHKATSKIDLSNISTGFVSVNSQKIKITEAVNFENLIQTFQNQKRTSFCQFCTLFSEVAQASEASTYKWKNIESDFKTQRGEDRIRFTLTALVSVGAQSVNAQCYNPDGQSYLEKAKNKISYLASNSFSGTSVNKVFVGRCDDSPSSKVLSYMSGFSSFNFTCEKSRVSKISFRKSDYLVDKEDYSANLNFDYSSDRLKITKLTSKSSDSCVYSADTQTSDVLQVVSTTKNSPFCAANNAYFEFRAGDKSSQQVDVKKRLLITAKPLDPRSILENEIAVVAKDFENKIQRWERRSLNVQKISIRTDCNKINSEYCHVFPDGDEVPTKYYLSQTCTSWECLNCKDVDSCQREILTRVVDFKKMRDFELSELRKKLESAPAGVVEKPAKLYGIIPTQNPFFKEVVGVGRKGDSPRSLEILRQPFKINNISPLANIELISSCCADPDCKLEVDNTMASISGRSEPVSKPKSGRN